MTRRPKHPVQHVHDNGRVVIGVDSRGQPAASHERVTGWVDPSPTNHRKRAGIRAWRSRPRGTDEQP